MQWAKRISIGFAIVIAAGILWTVLRPAQPIPNTDPLAAFDNQIQQFDGRYQEVDAYEFFENGGVYCDHEQAKPFDRPFIVPILKRLAEKHDLAWTAVVDPRMPQDALWIYAPLPTSLSKRVLRDSLQAEQDRLEFQGDILQQWGHSHLSLDFLTPEEVASEMASEF